MVRLFTVSLLTVAVTGSISTVGLAQRRTAPRPPAPVGQRPAALPSFTTPLTLAEMSGKQAVVNTTAGAIVIDLRPDLAPNHVGYFMKLAREGQFDGTIFHRVLRLAIIQGGDPLSKDPSKAKLYGTGGLGVLAAELGAEPQTRGAASAVLQPGKPDSGGAQFFVCVTDQPSLGGKYTVFGRVSEGMEVVQKISEAPATPEGMVRERIEILSVDVRDTPPPEPEPFSTESVEALRAYRAILETSAGPITIEFFPDKAPGHVKNFLDLVRKGTYEGTTFHRVIPGFMIQGGGFTADLGHKPTREPIKNEANNGLKNAVGTIAMARTSDPHSATSQFFINVVDNPALDYREGNFGYAVFGKVVSGMDVVQSIATVQTAARPPHQNVPVKPVVIESARVLGATSKPGKKPAK